MGNISPVVSFPYRQHFSKNTTAPSTNLALSIGLALSVSNSRYHHFAIMDIPFSSPVTMEVVHHKSKAFV